MNKVAYLPMHSNAIKGLYSWLVNNILLSLLFLNIPVWFYAINPSFLPKYFYFAIAAICLPRIITHINGRSIYSPNALFAWTGAFIFLYFLHYIALSGDNTIQASFIATDLQSVGLAAIYASAFSCVPRASYRFVFPLLVVVAAACVILDFAVPGQFYDLASAEEAALGVQSNGVLGRGAGLYLNPNRAAETLIFLLLLCVAWTRGVMLLFLLIIGGVGMMLTFSRAGLVAWFLLWPVALWTKALPRYVYGVLAASVVVVPAFVVIVMNYVEDNPAFEGARKNIEERINFFGDLSVEDASSLERKAALELGIQTFEKYPLFGAGSCYTDVWDFPVSTHNMPVRMLAEFGLTGLLIWLWIIYLLWTGDYLENKNLQIAAALFFVFLSAFSHNLFDSPQMLLIYALITQRSLPMRRNLFPSAQQGTQTFLRPFPGLGKSSWQA